MLPRFAAAQELAAETLRALALDEPLPRVELRFIAPADAKQPVLDVAAALRA